MIGFAPGGEGYSCCGRASPVDTSDGRVEVLEMASWRRAGVAGRNNGYASGGENLLSAAGGTEQGKLFWIIS